MKGLELAPASLLGGGARGECLKRFRSPAAQRCQVEIRLVVTHWLSCPRAVDSPGLTPWLYIFGSPAMPAPTSAPLKLQDQEA